MTADERVADALARLTLGEKVAATMASASQGFAEPGGFPSIGLPQLMESEALHGLLAGCLPAKPGEQVRCPTSFPAGIGLGATFNRTLWQAVGQAIGTEGRAYHNMKIGKTGLIYWTPDVNLVRDPRWGRAQEVPGEDPFLTGEYAAAFVTGMQGNDAYQLAGATCKHFSAYDVEAGRHSFDANVSRRDLVEFHWPAFQKCAEARVASVMCSYNAVNGVPSCANGEFQNDLLRSSWGFDGVIVSDCEAIRNIAIDHNYTRGNLAKAVAVGIRAGTDTDCGPDEYRDYAGRALQQGLLSEADLNRAIQRVLKASFRLGEFEGNKSVPAKLLGSQHVDSPEHRALALRAAEESLVLLRNQGGLLPLDTHSRNLAFIGPHANATHDLLSGYEGQNLLVNSHSPLQAASAMGLQVTYERGHGGINDGNRSLIPAAVAAARAADVAVVFLGMSSPACEGESHDRGAITLSGAQEPLLEAVLQAQPRTVVVLIGGGQLAVEAARHCQNCAVLYAFYPGELGGDAIVRTLVGLNNPSGRLPYTLYPKNVISHRNIHEMDLRSHEGLTYRWYTGKLSGPALWNFGEGGSYTSFRFEWIRGPTKIAILAESGVAPLRYVVRVFNTGHVSGSTPVLAFIEGGDGQVAPLRALVGFAKVSLAPGQSALVHITTSVAAAFATVDNMGRHWLRACQRVIVIGGGNPTDTSVRRQVQLVGLDVVVAGRVSDTERLFV